MKYTIQYDEDSDKYVMNGKSYRYVGEHLYDIAVQNTVTTTANSESHHMTILEAHGIEIELLDSDGSKLDW